MSSFAFMGDTNGMFLIDTYFSIPLSVTRRKLSGIKDSLVTSSVWTTKFKRTLELKHNLELVSLEYAVNGCDACRLGGRLATIIARLTGKQYNRETYEVCILNHGVFCINYTCFVQLESGSEDEDDDSDDDSEEEDEEDTISKVGEFHLGRFCAKRARVWHLYTHWEVRYSMFHDSRW